MQNKQLQESLINIVTDLEEQGIDLSVDYALFEWRYPERMDIKYQLLIMKSEPEEKEVFVSETLQ